jgi:hypothetical protein
VLLVLQGGITVHSTTEPLLSARGMYSEAFKRDTNYRSADLKLFKQNYRMSFPHIVQYFEHLKHFRYNKKLANYF